MNLFCKIILYFKILANFQLNLAHEQIRSSLELFDYQNTPVKLTILIATIEKRETKFIKLYHKLLAQIKKNNLTLEVEILLYQDNQTCPLGRKRNLLVEHAKGKYICFIDDDDDICNNYVSLIYNALKTNPDCVNCPGILYRPGSRRPPQKFVHSLKYHSAFIKNKIACSPVYHLNPIKRKIAILVKFPEQNYNEDTIWAKKLYDLNLLKNEFEIIEPYYFYYYDYHKSQAIPDCAKQDRSIKWTPQGKLIRK